MAKFRKKPVVIEAFQITHATRESNADWPEWLHEAWNKPHDEPGSLFPSEYPNSDGTDQLKIFTLEGIHRVGWDDWIVQGVSGEIYPVKPDIFVATYDEE